MERTQRPRHQDQNHFHNRFVRDTSYFVTVTESKCNRTGACVTTLFLDMNETKKMEKETKTKTKHKIQVNNFTAIARGTSHV